MRRGLFTSIVIFCFIAVAFAQEQQYDKQFAHEKDINAIVFSPDNNLIITAGADKVVRVWNANTGQLVNSFKHGYIIKKLFISPDGNYMLSRSSPMYSCLWDIKTGTPVKCFTSQQIEGFTPDGQNLIIVEYGNDGKKFATISLLSLDNYFTTTSPQRIYLQDSAITNVALSAKGKYYVAIEGNKKLWVLDANWPNKKMKYKLKPETEILAVSPKNNYIITEGSSCIYNVKTYKQAVKLKEPLEKEGKNKLSFSSDGRFLISEHNGIISIIDTSMGRVVNKLEFGDAKILAVSPSGRMVAYSLDGKTLSLWNVNRNREMVSYVDAVLNEQLAYNCYLRGIYHYNNNRYTEALKYLNLAYGKTLRAKKILIYKGDCLLMTGKPDLAIECYLHDDSIAPTRASLNLARAYVVKHRYDKAIMALNKYAKSGHRERVSVLLADSFLAALQNQPGWEAFVLANSPSNAEKMVEKAEKKAKEGDMPGAMEVMNKALLLDPKNPCWYNARAALYITMGEYDNAIRDYIKEGKLDTSRLAQVYFDVAKATAKKGDVVKAAYYLERSVEKDPVRFGYYVDIAMLKNKARRRKEAMEIINKYIAIVPDDYYAYYVRANIQGNDDEIRNDILKAIDICKERGNEVPSEFYQVFNTVK